MYSNAIVFHCSKPLPVLYRVDHANVPKLSEEYFDMPYRAVISLAVDKKDKRSRKSNSL